MSRAVTWAAVAGAILLAGRAPAEVKSGIEVGEAIKAFNPQHVTGPDAGKSSCLVWKNGGNPVVAIFAREIDDNLTGLVKKVDEATRKNRKAEMGSFVIFLDKSEDMEKKVKELGEKQDLKETVLALDNPAGPNGYKIAKEASVTILLYTGRKVKANFAYEKGKLTAAEVDKVLKELPKLLED
jgi:hypothetical protein